MRLVCTADERAWADVVDVWTRKMLREFSEAVAEDAKTGTSDKTAAHYRRVVKSAHLCDAEGNEYDLDGILAIENFDDVDAAVSFWWGGLPWLAYAERQKMGEARRVN